jgi:TldD protein
MISTRDFFRNICDAEQLSRAAMEAFCGGNLGELFVEYTESETFCIEDGVMRTPTFRSARGFGLRSFYEDSSRYSFSASLDTAAVKNAVSAVVNSQQSQSPCRVYPKNLEHNLYTPQRFCDAVALEDKIQLLKNMNAYARSKSMNLKHITVVLSGSWQAASVTKDSGEQTEDFRPLVRLSVSVVVEQDKKLESGLFSGGGRFGYEQIMAPAVGYGYVDEALRQADVKLNAVAAPAGEMPVVLGNGWTGILLHEAIGHGLEGDSIRKKTSSFYNLFGESIGSAEVTVVDDGSLENRRGSINMDDEGIPSQRNVLIEKGKLVGFLQDRMNARLMGTSVTGNGRRENHENLPIPRMTNTFMLAGKHEFGEMISSVPRGVYAKSFADGQVDVASGKFVFSASEAYLIENGKITTPIKGAMLIGDGPSVLKKISMVGADFAMDPGTGSCGKDGQWVPVGVGEPSILIDGITVGGANLG